MKRGFISLGIKDEKFDGLWRVKGNEVIFEFDRPLPRPYNSKRVSLPFKKFEPMLPYELGGQIVNRCISED